MACVYPALQQYWILIMIAYLVIIINSYVWRLLRSGSSTPGTLKNDYATFVSKSGDMQVTSNVQKRQMWAKNMCD